MEVELFGFVAAAAAELVDHRQADRKVIALESERARRLELGRLLDEPTLGQPEQDLVRVVGRKEPSVLCGRSDRRALSVIGLDEDALELHALVFASVDAQGDASAEPVELIDLDRRAERARVEVE